jgi:hypothetical protein
VESEPFLEEVAVSALFLVEALKDSVRLLIDFAGTCLFSL